jgi:3-dehydroquinate synthetase
MNYDKKVKNQVIYFVLTKGIGHVTLAAISESDELKGVLAAAGWPS